MTGDRSLSGDSGKRGFPRRFDQRPYEAPPGATELVLVRHGASEVAIEGQSFELVDGQGDPPLAAKGRKQAQAVCRRLAAAGISAIVVTPLGRTAETAEPLATRLKLVPTVERDLREVFLGEWEGGLLRQKIADRDPLALRMITEERWDVIPGAETAGELALRTRSAIGRIVDRNPGAKVGVFTHGGIIGVILAEASGSRPFAFVGADNASISRLVIDGDRWVVRGFNDVSHLGDASPDASPDTGAVNPLGGVQ